MLLQHLSLADFRSWPRLDVSFEPGPNVLVGSNGQGKTNVLEAVGYLATLGSHRVAADAPLIRMGADRAVVQGAVVSEGRQLVIEVEISAGRANKAKLNRSAVSRPRDILGGLRRVLFAPEDLSIVRGDPSERRRFLDEVLVQRAPRYAGVRADYERVLKQRAALLKSAGATRRSGSASDLRTLDVWDGHLAEHGAELLAGRLRLVEQLRPYAVESYANLAPTSGELGLRYVSSIADGRDNDTDVIPDTKSLIDALLSGMAQMRSQEIDRGINLVGPHRDELELSLNGMPLRGYASHGEGWSAALALRLACYQLLSADGAEPVLVLDDVFAELDVARRTELARIASKAEQVLISAAVIGDVPESLDGARYEVGGGQARRVG